MNPRQFRREARTEEGRDRDFERRVRALEAMRASQLAIDEVPGLAAKDTQVAIALLASIVSSGALVDAVDDAAAATAGVAINHFYRTGNAVKVRLA